MKLLIDHLRCCKPRRELSLGITILTQIPEDALWKILPRLSMKGTVLGLIFYKNHQLLGFPTWSKRHLLAQPMATSLQTFEFRAHGFQTWFHLGCLRSKPSGKTAWKSSIASISMLLMAMALVFVLSSVTSCV